MHSTMIYPSKDFRRGNCFSSRCHNCRNFSKFIMNKTCNFQCKVTYIKITNTLISVLKRKSLKESHDLFYISSYLFINQHFFPSD